MTVLGYGTEHPSKLFKYSVVLLRAEPHVAKYFPQEGAHDYLGAVVRDYNDPSVGIPKSIVATFASNPLKTCSLDNLAQFPVGD